MFRLIKSESYSHSDSASHADISSSGFISHESLITGENIPGKVRGYIAYFDGNGFQKKFPGMQSFRVIFVTETRARAESLRTRLVCLLPTVKLQRAYRFIALQDLGLDALLPTAPGNSLTIPAERVALGADIGG